MFSIYLKESKQTCYLVGLTKLFKKDILFKRFIVYIKYIDIKIIYKDWIESLKENFNY